MPRLMDIGLERLTNMVVDMANLAERAVRDSLTAFLNKPGFSSDQIFHFSEQLQILREETNDLAVELLARYQPLAKDLRFIKACNDIAYDLSRFGRYAYDISLTPDWMGDLSACDFAEAMDSAEKALAMIEKSIVAFKNRDVQLAKTLPSDDDVIDRKYKEVIVGFLENGSSKMRCALSATLLMRHIERIADHACYVADSVVYMVEGQKLGLH